MMKNFNKKQNGFTLVELVVVVAVVGVLAVVATPKIMGVATDARQATLNGIAGALADASSRNFAQRSAEKDDANVANKTMTTCPMAATVLEGDDIPARYTISPANLDLESVTTDATTGVVTVVTAGATDCTIMTDGTPTLTSVFKVMGIN